MYQKGILEIFLLAHYKLFMIFVDLNKYTNEYNASNPLKCDLNIEPNPRQGSYWSLNLDIVLIQVMHVSTSSATQSTFFHFWQNIKVV
jgi:hypothetical protein